MAIELAVPGAKATGQSVKRLVDIFGAAVCLVLAAPVFAIVGLSLAVTTGGKVIFRQARLGKDGKIFAMLKFYTMRPMSDADFKHFLDRNPLQKQEYARYQKLAHDPRLTRLGRFLRQTSLDELPQLWNVLRGEMSLIGPRPILPEQAQMYGRPLELYIRARPGMTGLWQVSGRNCLSWRERVDCDRAYLARWSIRTDISILLRTPWVVLHRKGAY